MPATINKVTVREGAAKVEPAERASVSHVALPKGQPITLRFELE